LITTRNRNLLVNTEIQHIAIEITPNKNLSILNLKLLLPQLYADDRNTYLIRGLVNFQINEFSINDFLKENECDKAISEDLDRLLNFNIVIHLKDNTYEIREGVKTIFENEFKKSKLSIIELFKFTSLIDTNEKVNRRFLDQLCSYDQEEVNIELEDLPIIGLNKINNIINESPDDMHCTDGYKLLVKYHLIIHNQQPSKIESQIKEFCNEKDKNTKYLIDHYDIPGFICYFDEFSKKIEALSNNKIDINKACRKQAIVLGNTVPIKGIQDHISLLITN
jgi:hypothetical protein